MTVIHRGESGERRDQARHPVLEFHFRRLIELVSACGASGRTTPRRSSSLDLLSRALAVAVLFLMSIVSRAMLDREAPDLLRERKTRLLRSKVGSIYRARSIVPELDGLSPIRVAFLRSGLSLRAIYASHRCICICVWLWFLI